MEDWHIVALVFMIVVFLLVIALYAFLWSRSPFVGQRRCAPHLLYYFHISGDVRVLDLSTMVASQSVSRDAVVAAIAQECGLDVKDVGLHRVDETLGVVVAIDDTTFFGESVRAANISNTAAYP
ncbi:MAG: hypothetical protein Q8J97_06595, partial [Flavobacteriaceae bacterium]|nr:hypothetical protein [Flavobacteriaceae bacterium]